MVLIALQPLLIFIGSIWHLFGASNLPVYHSISCCANTLPSWLTDKLEAIQRTGSISCFQTYKFTCCHPILPMSGSVERKLSLFCTRVIPLAALFHFLFHQLVLLTLQVSISLSTKWNNYSTYWKASEELLHMKNLEECLVYIKHSVSVSCYY